MGPFDKANEERPAELERLKFRERSVTHRWHTAMERLAHSPDGRLQRQADALAAELDEIREAIRALSGESRK